MLISLNNVKKYYGDDLIIDGAQFEIQNKSRIGVVGINGSGKTTLLNMLARIIPCDEGEISYTPDLSIGYLKQNDNFDESESIFAQTKRAFEPLLKIQERMKECESFLSRSYDSREVDPKIFKEISSEYSRLQSFFEKSGGYDMDTRINTILNGMGFDSSSYEKKVANLSGGEKTRLAICRLLLEEPNLLLLDEPTNHLDFKTLTWLENYLCSYKGALMVVSHDRYFLDKVADRIIEIENLKVREYKGNYTKYRELKSLNAQLIKKEYDKNIEERNKLEDYAKKNIVRASTSAMAKSRLKAIDRMEPPRSPPRLKSKRQGSNLNTTLNLTAIY